MLRVLVVEDEPVLLNLMAQTLLSCGADVAALSDGEEALIAVKSEKFDGIVLDLLMPGVTGLEVTREVRRSSCNRTTPVVIVTGLDQPNTMRTVFAAGATFLLHKPVDRQKVIRLFDTIRGTMLEERRRSRRIPLAGVVTCMQGARALQGRGGDLSERVIFFQTDNLLRKDDAVTLRFQLPGWDQETEVSAIVVRADSKRVGCHFVNMAETDREAIRRAIASVSRTGSAALGGW